MALHKILPLIFSIAILPVIAVAQPGGGMSREGYGMVKTNISISYGHEWGNISDGFSARASYELLSDRHSTFTANARYTSTETDFGEGDVSGDYSPDAIGVNGIHVMGQIGMTYTYRTMLGGKPIVAMGMLNGDIGAGRFQRISGIVMGLYMLRATRTTRFGLGPLVMLNSTSKIPAFLVFMYHHRFNDRWAVNVYGGMMGFDYTPSRDDMFSLGADIDVKSFYFTPGDSRLPKHCRFTSTAFRPMVKYRRRLLQNLYLDVQAGATIKMSCRVNGINGTKEYFQCHRKAAPFVQAAMSYSL